MLFPLGRRHDSWEIDYYLIIRFPTEERVCAWAGVGKDLLEVVNYLCAMLMLWSGWSLTGLSKIYFCRTTEPDPKPYLLIEFAEFLGRNVYVSFSCKIYVSWSVIACLNLISLSLAFLHVCMCVCGDGVHLG